MRQKIYRDHSMTKFTLDLNNQFISCPCALCGSRVDPNAVEIFPVGDVLPLCDECAAHDAPALVARREKILAALSRVQTDTEGFYKIAGDLCASSKKFLETRNWIEQTWPDPPEWF